MRLKKCLLRCWSCSRRGCRRSHNTLPSLTIFMLSLVLSIYICSCFSLPSVMYFFLISEDVWALKICIFGGISKQCFNRLWFEIIGKKNTPIFFCIWMTTSLWLSDDLVIEARTQEFLWKVIKRKKNFIPSAYFHKFIFH